MDKETLRIARQHEALLNTLKDKTKEAQLRSICLALKRPKGNLLEHVYCGVNNATPLSVVADLLKVT